jgi:TRAP-type C4-dicarboxylate transport system permease large subunit
MPIFIFLAWVWYFIAHDKYITPLEKTKIQQFLSSHYNSLIILNIVTLFFMGYYGDVIKSFLFSHTAILYTFTFLIFFLIIELLAINNNKKKK